MPISDHANSKICWLTFSLCEQAFTNCVHGYDRADNVHTNGITCARKFVHGIDLFLQKLIL